MFAPIITKDMKLFPTEPLSNCIKNVRSRKCDDTISKQPRSNSSNNCGYRQTKLAPQIAGTIRTRRSSSILLRCTPKLDAILEEAELQSRRSYTSSYSSTTSLSEASSSLSSNSISSITSSKLNISTNDNNSTISIVSTPMYKNTTKNYRKRFLKLVAESLKLKSGKRGVIFGEENTRVRF
uniref:Transcription repressor n=1 Tax=Syphacia muris TaxID=451379 RepID=A0A0N5AYQ9_9BILA